MLGEEKIGDKMVMESEMMAQIARKKEKKFGRKNT